MKRGIVFVLAMGLAATGWAQVNSGSTGADGAFNPTETNTVVNMADHPTGIYNYSAVNIPAYVTVTFLPNPNNTPVVWLVQSNVVINGKVDVSGQNPTNAIGAAGGPGGWMGGSGGNSPIAGQGPGGGNIGSVSGGNASYATPGQTNGVGIPPGATYGNKYVLPLLGGSGGGGCSLNSPGGGGGGGGAILIASSSTIQFNGGQLIANGGVGNYGGSGSGGAIRLVAATIAGNGYTGSIGSYWGAGDGRIRFDCLQNTLAAGIVGSFTQGSQFIIFPATGQGAALTVTSVGGVAVSAAPTGQLATPDAVLAAQQGNPVPVVVSCANLPLNTPITVTVKPATGAAVSAIGSNSVGTVAASTATVNIVMPRGGGLIYATAAVAP